MSVAPTPAVSTPAAPAPAPSPESAEEGQQALSRALDSEMAQLRRELSDAARQAAAFSLQVSGVWGMVVSGR